MTNGMSISGGVRNEPFPDHALLHAGAPLLGLLLILFSSHCPLR